MPFIQTRTNITITKEKEAQLKQRLGEIITTIGKSEHWLMLEFKDNANMYFQGQNNMPIAYVDIKLYGSASSDAYEKMTMQITELLSSELGINPSNIYVSYVECSTWGYGGHNF